MHWIRATSILCVLFAPAGPASAQPARQPLAVLDVPFIAQTEALCGGAAAAMILRYWGERGLSAESFAHLVDRSAAGIRTTALVGDLTARGWDAFPIEGTHALIEQELARGRPVLTLIEDRPGTFHYIVIVSATPAAIVFHDPARAPFRVMTRGEFARRWDDADRWMAVVVPGKAPGAGERVSANLPADAGRLVETDRLVEADLKVGLVSPASGTCDDLIASGIRAAQANDLDAAERALASALSCPGGFRELAGVRLLQRRWPDVAQLATAAVTEDRTDAHAWRLLATSRFLQDDLTGALDAWNVAGEPRIDLISVMGLARTRQQVVETLLGLETGTVLSAGAFARTRRRLQLLPSAVSSRVEIVPVPGGLAEVRANVAERPLLPRDAWSYVAIGAAAAARREVEVVSGPVSGGGERVSLAWRFWRERPRVHGAFAAPAPWGGVWAIDAGAEKQPFDSGFPTADRHAVGLAWTNWLSPLLRVDVRGGVDRWLDRGNAVTGAARLRLASDDERLAVDVDVAGWAADAPFGALAGRLRLQSPASRRGMAYVGAVGAAVTSRETPPDLWLAGDTGHARPIPLRAHPVLDDGRLRTERLGRGIAFASAEVRHWWRTRFAVPVGAALFVDAAHLRRRLVVASPLADVDVGAGARLALPGTDGMFRLDIARGLRDGATAVSFTYEPW